MATKSVGFMAIRKACIKAMDTPDVRPDVQ